MKNKKEDKEIELLSLSSQSSDVAGPSVTCDVPRQTRFFSKISEADRLKAKSAIIYTHKEPVVTATNELKKPAGAATTAAGAQVPAPAKKKAPKKTFKLKPQKHRGALWKEQGAEARPQAKTISPLAGTQASST